MLKNYLTVVLRNFLRHRFFSFINIIGLTTGLACTMLIYLWIKDEMGKDRFHRDIDRIYHVVTNVHNPEKTLTWAITPGPLAEEIQTNIPEVIYAVHVANDGPCSVQQGPENFLLNSHFTDPEFFKIFSYKILKGDASHPLPDPGSVVITQSTARKLFGSDNPVGKVITVREENDLKVTAVMEDVPANSSMKFDFIAHFDVHKKYREQNWNNYDYPLFIKFREGADIAAVTDKINAHMATLFKHTEEQKKQQAYYLQPYGDSYLYATFENGFPVGGRIKYVRIFSIVAIFILIVACVNFMNMATARAGIRHKEIGVRKVIGAQRRSLIGQFISESVLLTTFSMFLALVLVELALPFFNELTLKRIDVQYHDPEFFIPVLLIILFTGLLAGSYPALVLSNVNPVRVLKGSGNSVMQGALLRKALVIFQFSISVILIVSSLIIYQQMDYIKSKNLGYTKENVLIIPVRNTKDYGALLHQMRQVPGVTNASRSNQSIVEVYNQNNSFHWKGKPEGNLYVRTIRVDYDFVETVNLKVMEGRSFKEEFNDISNVIISRKLASLMNIENPVGMKINQWGTEGTIVGIVEDFHTRPMTEAIDPMVIQCEPAGADQVYVSIESGKAIEIIPQLEAVLKTASPGSPFEYSFLDDQFNNLYRDEAVMEKLALGFTTMAILISGLGLLGLASYSTERRKKEISIRKTLGASVQHLIVMMSKEFVILVGVALLIGSPLACYFLDHFLQGYAYRTDIGASAFIITTLCLAFVTMAVTLFQVTRTALANPVDNLRNE